MPRRAPRYGFIAEEVILETGTQWRSTSTGTMVNISEGGMCVLLPQSDLDHPNAPTVGAKVDVSFKPVLLHKSPIEVGRWKIGQAEVKWVERLPSGAAALGVAFTEGSGVPAAVRDWVSCMSEPQATVKTGGWRAFVRGFNALGVGLAVAALVFLDPGTLSWYVLMGILIFSIVLLAADEWGLGQWLARRLRP